MSMYGLYQPYKINRPLNNEEKKNKLHQGRTRNVKFYSCGESVIRINSTYMEVVDKFHKGSGTNSWWAAMLFFGSMGVIIYLFFKGMGGLFLEHGVVKVLFSMMIFMPINLLGGYFLFKEWFKWTHYPIRLNRKTKMVYVFRLDGTVMQAHWNEIFFTQVKDPGPLRDVCIRGHLLATDKETILETFSLGIRGCESLIYEYWEFIRCYMEEEVVSELSELIVLCPPIESKKEGFVFGLQNLLYMESRLEWIFLPITLPFYFVSSILRFIASQTSKIPSWPQDIQEACEPDIDDPINVSADNNPQQMWKLVFANQPLDVWQKKYDRMDTANQRIHAVLNNKYRATPFSAN